MATNARRRITVDADRVARFPGSVRKGDLENVVVMEQSWKRDGFRVRPSSSPSSYPVSPSLSAAANPDLRALLLDPAAVGRLKAAAGRGAAAARRRAAWTRAWAGMRREEAELEEEVGGALESAGNGELASALREISRENVRPATDVSKDLRSSEETVMRELDELVRMIPELLGIPPKGGRAKKIGTEKVSASPAVTTSTLGCLECAAAAEDSGEDACGDCAGFSARMAGVRAAAEDRLSELKSKASFLFGRRPPRPALEMASHLARVFPEAEDASGVFGELMGVGGVWLSYRSVALWAEEERQLKAAREACMADFGRRAAAIVEEWRKVVAVKNKERERRAATASRSKEQSAQCAKLKEEVSRLREEWKKAEEIRRKERESLEREAAEAERRKKLKETSAREEAVEAARRRREEERVAAGRRLAALREELRAGAARRREAALGHRIRVNFRRVASAKRADEAREEKARERMEELSREARLESLRRSARRKLGVEAFLARRRRREALMLLDDEVGEGDQYEDEEEKKATSNTEAVEHRLRERREEREDRRKGRGRWGYTWFQFGISSGYSDEEILSDPRLALESALREQGLLAGGRGAAEYGLALVEPPTRPRPDAVSQISLGETN